MAINDRTIFLMLPKQEGATELEPGDNFLRVQTAEVSYGKTEYLGVDLRECFVNDDGEAVPTKKGIMLRPNQLKSVMAALKAAVEEVEAEEAKAKEPAKTASKGKGKKPRTLKAVGV